MTSRFTSANDDGMSLGRRKVTLDDAEAWVFNRMADSYRARPAYPAALLDVIASSAGMAPRAVLDVGAGLGHLAVPLAQRGYLVTAVEPARAMLVELERRARADQTSLVAIHAQAEAMPLPSASFDLVVVADALHFLDATRSANEIDRVLARSGALALLQVEFADTAFMRAVRAVMDDAAPRRPRAVAAAAEQLFRVARVRLELEADFSDENRVDRATLAAILDSISFIGPAMNAARSAAFRQRIEALPHDPVWARSFRLCVGRASARRRLPR